MTTSDPLRLASGLLFLLGSVAMAAPAKLSYNNDVQPLLSEYCFHCHGPDVGTRLPKELPFRLDKAEFAFQPRENGKPAIVKGDPVASLLVQRLHSTKDDQIMPPPDSHKKMKPEEIAVLERWIREGAEYEPHWSFIPPKRPEVPSLPADLASWASGPLDAFLAARMSTEGLKPNPPEEKSRLLRRVTFDLTGLPPTPEETRAFLADNSPAAYTKVVDNLLTSPRYGEHMARYWLDAARYADSHGIHIDNYRAIWPYRDWVIAAFNRNEPYDRFTIEQIGGDLLPNATLDQRVATGFNRCLPTTGEGGAINEEYDAIYAKDRVDTTSGVWLGLTMGCASCHDHKFDPFTMKDFYSLTAFFRNTPMSALDGNNAEHPPNVFVPAAADRARWEALPNEKTAAEKAVAERAAQARPDFDRWLQSGAGQTAAPTETDLAVHVPFGETDGATHGVIDGAPRVLEGALDRIDGLFGKAPRFQNGGDFVVGEAGDVEADKPFCYGAYLRFTGTPNGAVVARMNPGEAFRGWDIWFEGGRVGGHIINHWPDKAAKIMSNRVLAPDQWHHVLLAFDPALPPDKRLQLYVDGKPEPYSIQSKSLEGTIRTKVPLRFGRRDPAAGSEGPLQGGAVAVQDFRLYRRGLAAPEIAALAEGAAVRAVLALPADQRTPPQTESLFRHYLATIDAPTKDLTAKLEALRQEEAAMKGRGSVSLVMEERKNAKPEARILERGQYDKPKETVGAAVPAALPPMPESFPRNRLGLGQWLVDPSNPLTARVTVNRYWHQFFGTGIVETTEDFGATGARPSHPELLDWLAVEFRESGWDVRKLVRTIVTSSAYRQSAQATPEKLEKDPRNRLLSRGPRQRLDAEQIRDMALAASGLLVEKIGGPSVRPYQPEGVWEAVAMKESNTRNYKQDEGENLYRRSLYTFWKRTAPHPAMEILNAPVREVFCTRRERTNTPLQALVVLNDPQFVEACRVLAERTLAEAPAAPARFDALSMRLLARPLQPKEQEILARSLQEFLAAFQAKPEEAKKFLAVGARPPAAQVPPPELAAWTLVASQLLNRDECLTR